MYASLSLSPFFYISVFTFFYICEKNKERIPIFFVPVSLVPAPGPEAGPNPPPSVLIPPVTIILLAENMNLDP
jgi:hypothetical protein